MTKIFNDIPVPPRKVRTSKVQDFDQLEVGQSIYFEPKADEPAEKAAGRISGSVARFRRAQPIDTLKFAVRVCPHPETGAQVVGVWRTA